MDHCLSPIPFSRESSLQVQELLRHYGTTEEPPRNNRRGSRESTPTESNKLFLDLPGHIQDVVRPYLESKFQLASSLTSTEGVIFSPDMSFRRWLYQWMRQLVVHHASGLFFPMLLVSCLCQLACTTQLSGVSIMPPQPLQCPLDLACMHAHECTCIGRVLC